MPVTFQGLKNVGKKHGDNSQTSKATLSWLVQVLTADGNNGQVNVPNFGVISGWGFSLDPTSVQSSFTFGTAKALQLAIARFNSSVKADLSAWYSSGRTFVYVVATGQLFIFGPKSPQIVLTAPGAANVGLDTRLCIVPVNDSIQPSIIRVFIEADNLTGTLENPPNYAPVSVVATLFNYDVAPVGIT